MKDLYMNTLSNLLHLNSFCIHDFPVNLSSLFLLIYDAILYFLYIESHILLVQGKFTEVLSDLQILFLRHGE